MLTCARGRRGGHREERERPLRSQDVNVAHVRSDGPAGAPQRDGTTIIFESGPGIARAKRVVPASPRVYARTICPRIGAIIDRRRHTKTTIRLYCCFFFFFFIQDNPLCRVVHVTRRAVIDFTSCRCVLRGRVSASGVRAYYEQFTRFHSHRGHCGTYRTNNINNNNVLCAPFCSPAAAAV